MTDILGVLEKSYGKFTPGKPEEYLALQMARKLSDQQAVRAYLTLFDRHDAQLLLRVFREVAGQGKASGTEFIKRLRQLTQNQA